MSQLTYPFVRRAVNGYSLVENPENSKTLRFYIDNGEDVTEYMDEFDIDELFTCSDEDFTNECESYFK
jgi:hypothetical protein